MHHQDAVVAANELLVLSDRAAEKGIDSFELGRLHEREQEEVRTRGSGLRGGVAESLPQAIPKVVVTISRS